MIQNIIIQVSQNLPSKIGNKMQYTKNSFLTISTTLLLVIFALSPLVASEISIKSKEYKLLLKPSFFKSPIRDYHKFWAIVTRIAKDNGLKIQEAEKQYYPRIICFLDTKDHSMNKSAFILRVRANSFDTFNNNICSFDDAELVMKYRSPDLAASIVASVSGAIGLDRKVSMEEDKSIKLGKIVSVFSKSGKIYDPNSIPQTVNELLQYFPGTRKIEANEKTRLQIVNNVIIIEKRIRPGYIYIGDEKIKTLFSIWYKEDVEEPFIAEFSFKIETSSKLKVNSKVKEQQRYFPAEKVADEFFMQLSETGEIYLSDKQTKTGLVYK